MKFILIKKLRKLAEDHPELLIWINLFINYKV